MLAVAVLTALALASPASAAPIPIRHDRDAEAIALAGPDVIVASESTRHRVTLVALPRTGGKARTLLSLTNASLEFDEWVLAASPQRVAVIVQIEGKKGHPDEHRVYSGPPSGPLQLVRRTLDPKGDAWEPLIVSVDGDRMLLDEAIPSYSDDDDGGGDQVRSSILDASGWTAVPWASGLRAPVAIAGPYAAVSAEGPQRIELADLATGTALATLTGQSVGGRLSLDLAADGRIATTVEGGIVTASPGAPQQTLARSTRMTLPHFAGGSIAAVDDARGRLSLIGRDGKATALGPRSEIHTDVEADEQGVAWLFNGCLRYQPLGASAPQPKANPCPTSEVALWGIGPNSKLRGSTATAQIKCVASVSGRCRGRLLARSDIDQPIAGRGRFDIAVSNRWVKVPIRLNGRTVARIRHRYSIGLVVNAFMRNGTVGSGADYSSEFLVTAR